MERLVIYLEDFSVYMQERQALYELYGKNYENELPKIYEKLANILNSDDFFTEVVERRLYDKELQNRSLEELKLHLLIKLYDINEDKIGKAKTINEIEDKSVLEQINQILGDQQKRTYFETLFRIVKNLFNNYIYYFLQVYINENEPRLQNCEGVKDIKQCDFLIKRYHEFLTSQEKDKTPSSPLLDKEGRVIIRKGSLFHGTRYSESTIEGIASSGLESGQLHGVVEDGETFCCIDFFKTQRDSTPDEVCTIGKRFTNGTNQIVFIIEHEDLEGPTAMFPELTEYDAYNETTERGKEARGIVNVAGLPLDYTRAAAILMGIPASMISSIIINSGIENDEEKIDFLASKFPKASIISRTSSKIIRSPQKILKK